MKTSQLLERAAQVLDERGWHRFGFTPDGVGGIYLDTCAVCVLGAINVAAGNPPDWEFHRGGPASDAAVRFAGRLGLEGVDRYDVVDLVGDYWNDVVCIDGEQAIETLRAAAQAEREAGR